MSFDFDELKHKAGNMLEKGKKKPMKPLKVKRGRR